MQLVTLPGCLEAVLLQHVMPHARRDNLHLFKTSTLLEADVQALAYYPLQRHALRMLPQLLTAHYLLPTTYCLLLLTTYCLGLLLILMAMMRMQPEVDGSIVSYVVATSLVALSVVAACSDALRLAHHSPLLAYCASLLYAGLVVAASYV